jgi:SAM-dependent methyltransferase
MFLLERLERVAFSLWRRFKRTPRFHQLTYDVLARFTMKQRNWGLMNFGFAFPDGSKPLELTPTEESERYGLQMYHKVIGNISLENRTVLEVGCGRGGGAQFLARRFQPSHFTGVDLSKETIRFCQRTYDDSQLEFRRDNAMNLSFPDGSFDVVCNIESSYCYPDKKKFFEEAYRILCKGGSFHYADNFHVNTWPRRRSELLSAGFVIESAEDISKGVLCALEADEERRRLLIQRHVPWPFRKIVNHWAVLPGESTHTRLSAGETQYWLYIAKKSAGT